MKSANSDRTAVEIVAQTLTQSIERKTLKPGDKLPTQQQMEEAYGVSRIVIREAIKLLEGKGLLYSRQGSGIYVTEAPLPSQEVRALPKEYTLHEIFSLFEHIFNYACFAVTEREDLSEIQKLYAQSKEMYSRSDQLSAHEKFTYEASFGAHLVKLSDNTLAHDLFLLLIQPLTSMDYMLIVEDNYHEILWIDQELTSSLLDRDPHLACLWGRKRNQKTLQAIGNKKEFLERRYRIFG